MYCFANLADSLQKGLGWIQSLRPPSSVSQNLNKVKANTVPIIWCSLAEDIGEFQMNVVPYTFSSQLSCRSEGFARGLILSLGAMGWGSVRIQNSSRRRLLIISEFLKYVPGSVDYVELVDALGVYNAPVSYLSKPS